MDTYEYGKHMRRARRRAGMTPEYVAWRVGIRVEAIYRMEQGQHFPKLKTALYIIRVLGVSLDEWLGIAPRKRAWKEREGSIGEHARSLRKSRNMSSVQLSELSGITTASICNLEHGHYPPRLWTIVCLSKALDMSPGEYIGEPSPESAG